MIPPTIHFFLLLFPFGTYSSSSLGARGPVEYREGSDQYCSDGMFWYAIESRLPGVRDAIEVFDIDIGIPDPAPAPAPAAAAAVAGVDDMPAVLDNGIDSSPSPRGKYPEPGRDCGALGVMNGLTGVSTFSMSAGMTRSGSSKDLTSGSFDLTRRAEGGVFVGYQTGQGLTTRSQ